MPDVSKHKEILDDLKKGTYHTLGLMIGPRKINVGEKIPKQETKPNPTLLAPPELPRQGVYTAIALDLDAPFVSFNLASPVAHLVQTSLKIKQPAEGDTFELQSEQNPIAPWIPCGAPPGFVPHRYVFYLYEQPDSAAASSLKTLRTRQRIRFHHDAIVKQLGLGKLVAVTYFVSN